MQTTFKKADIAVMALLVLCALALIALPLLTAHDISSATLTVSYRDGRSESVPLGTNQTLFLHGENGHTLTVRVENGGACVIESSCPDGICRMGTIRSQGEMLVCEPAGIALTVTNGEGGEADAILG